MGLGSSPFCCRIGKLLTTLLGMSLLGDQRARTQKELEGGGGMPSRSRDRKRHESRPERSRGALTPRGKAKSCRPRLTRSEAAREPPGKITGRPHAPWQSKKLPPAINGGTSKQSMPRNLPSRQLLSPTRCVSLADRQGHVGQDSVHALGSEAPLRARDQRCPSLDAREPLELLSPGVFDLGERRVRQVSDP